MTRHITLLVNARDPGAAAHLSVVVQRALEAPDLVVLPHAGPAAAAAMRSATILPVIETPEIVVASSRTMEAASLRDMARRILQKVEPDVILVGLSGPGAGLDEALLEVRGDLPTLAFQDFWGDVNLMFGVAADTYLVIDDEAARLSEEVYGVDTVVVGAPRYAHYARLELRHPDPSEVVVGFCGQPLGDYPGYLATVAALAEAVAADLPHAHLAYRPHPKESPELQDHVMQTLQRHHRPCSRDAAGEVETFLTGCHVVTSAFSTCSTDLVHLHRVSDEPLGTALHLHVDPEIRDLYRSWTGLDHHPLAALELAQTVVDRDEVGAALRQSVTLEARRATHRTARTRLADPKNAAERILDVIRGVVESRR